MKESVRCLNKTCPRSFSLPRPLLRKSNYHQHRRCAFGLFLYPVILPCSQSRFLLEIAISFIAIYFSEVQRSSSLDICNLTVAISRREETGNNQELAVMNTGPHCRHLARNASCLKATPQRFLGSPNLGTTEKPKTRQAPVPTGAAEIEVKPSGVVRVLAKTTAGSHRPSHDHAASAPNPTRANPKNEMMQMK